MGESGLLRVRHPRCPYCHESVTPSDHKTACDACMAWQHQECWDANRRCASCFRYPVQDDTPLRTLEGGEAPTDTKAIQILPPQDPFLGEVAGGFRLERRIRRSCTGFVYYRAQAVDDPTDEVIVQLGDKVSDEYKRRELAARWELEAEVYAKVRHPSLAGARAGGLTAAGLPFLARDEVEGEFLQAGAKEVKGDLNTAAGLALELARGLGSIHAAGLVHSRISPRNIRLTARGPRLLCFDASPVLRTVESFRALVDTQVGFLPSAPQNEPAYLAPEVFSRLCSKRVTLDSRLDIYTFGLVFYFLLTGVEPLRASLLFPSGQAYELVPPPEEHRPAIPDRYRRVLGKTLEKSPDLRYDGARALINDLEALAVLPPISAGEPRIWGKRSEQPRRKSAKLRRLASG